MGKYDIVKNLVEKQLKEQYELGIRSGAKAICEAIIQRASDDDSTAEERIKSIVDFCEICIGNNDE